MWQCVAALPSWAPSAAFEPHAKRIRIHQDQNHRHMITTWSHIHAFSLGVDALWLWRTCGSWRSSKCQHSIRRKTPWDPSRFRLALLPTTIWCPDQITKKNIRGFNVSRRFRLWLFDTPRSLRVSTWGCCSPIWTRLVGSESHLHPSELPETPRVGSREKNSMLQRNKCTTIDV